MTIVPKSKLPALSFCILYLVQWNMLVQHSWVQHFSQNYHDLKSGELFLSGHHWGWAGKLPLHRLQSGSPVVQDILKNTNKKKVITSQLDLYTFKAIFTELCLCVLTENHLCAVLHFLTSNLPSNMQRVLKMDRLVLFA